MTKQEYIEFQKETVAKSRTIYQKALGFCPSLFTKGKYSDFLSFLAKWNHFSAVNAVLLYMQYPAATYLSGFQKWQKLALEQGYDSNYMIIKPDQRKKGITLLIPFSFSNIQEVAGHKEDQRYLTYKSILVFDVSQINNLQAPPCFSPYVPITNLSFKPLITILREQFQNDFIIAPGSPEDPNFRFSRAYLRGNMIYYQDSAPDQDKIMDIIKEMVRFYVNKICKDEKENDLILLSTLYSIFRYYNYPTQRIEFSSIDFYQSLPAERLFRIIHYICTLTQYFIYEFHKAYDCFLSNYSDRESNRILGQYNES